MAFRLMTRTLKRHRMLKARRVDSSSSLRAPKSLTRRSSRAQLKPRKSPLERKSLSRCCSTPMNLRFLCLIRLLRDQFQKNLLQSTLMLKNLSLSLKHQRASVTRKSSCLSKGPRNNLISNSSPTLPTQDLTLASFLREILRSIFRL